MVHGLSSGEEDKKSKIQEAEIKELRVQVEQLRKQQGGEGGQKDPARRESGVEEDWNLDSEEEVERSWTSREEGCRSKWMILKNLRCMPQDIQSKLKESWQLELQDIEQMWNDFFAEAPENAKQVTNDTMHPG